MSNFEINNPIAGQIARTKNEHILYHCTKNDFNVKDFAGKIVSLGDTQELIEYNGIPYAIVTDDVGKYSLGSGLEIGVDNTKTVSISQQGVRYCQVTVDTIKEGDPLQASVVVGKVGMFEPFAPAGSGYVLGRAVGNAFLSYDKLGVVRTICPVEYQFSGIVYGEAEPATRSALPPLNTTPPTEEPPINDASNKQSKGVIDGLKEKFNKKG